MCIYIYMYIYTYEYIYIYVCVYVCVYYIYIYISQCFFRVSQKCPFLVSFFIVYYGYFFIKFVDSIEKK